MRKPLLKALIIFSLILTVFTACDNNVYMGEPERITPSLWKVNNTYFDSLQEAMDYIYGNTKGNSKSKSITDIPLSRTAILQRDVLHSNGETGGGLVVPEDFTGQLVIDFNGFTYEFDNSLDHFFDVRGGDEVYITNGTTVIYNEADHEPYALAVNTDTVTIDDHLIDDRRWDPTNNKSDAKLFDVGPEGSLVVRDIPSSSSGATLSGVIAIATDGIEKGGKIRITNSELVITNIFTTYQDSEGNIQPAIPSTVVVPEAAKSEIDILSGTVEIQDINQGTDYKDGSSLFIKAILNIIKADPEYPSRETLVKNPHKIDTIIEAIVDSVTDPAKKADKEIIHDLYDDWSTDDPGYPATCTESGLEVRWCHFDGCDIDGHGTKYSQSREIDALGHLVTTPYVTTDPDTHWHVCDRCHEHVDIAVHTFTEWTYGESVDFRDCTVCSRHEEKTHVHELVHHDRVPHTATTPGNIEYWHCNLCNNNYKDSEAKFPVADLTDPHVLEHHEAVHHTCTTDGNYEYWHCTVCGLNFADAEAATVITKIIDYAAHDGIEYHPYKEETCTEDGNIEYWFCSICEKYFTEKSYDSEKEVDVYSGEVQASDVILPKGHILPVIPTPDDYVYDDDHHWVECERCHEHFYEHEHEFEIIFDADISARKLSIESYCTTCKKRYVNVIPSATGAFDISMSIGIDVVRTAPGVNEWTISVKDSVKEANKYNTCTWYSQSGVELSGLYGTDPITVSISDEVEPGNYQIRCDFTDKQGNLVDGCILQISK